MKRNPATLMLPAALAVTTFVVLPACETGPSEGDGADDAAEDSGETGGIDCFEVVDMADCQAEAICNWDLDLEQCLPDCTVYQEQDACMAIDGCVWDSVEGCLGPFT